MHGLKCAILMLLSAAPAVGAVAGDGEIQDLRPIDLRTTDLEPVDAFVADATVLSTSLQVVQFGLQQSFNFEQLMQSEALGGQYVRRAGGLWAVSPSSTYMPTRSGYVATIAPGTVFYIGSLPGVPVANARSMETRRHEPIVAAPVVDANRYQARDTEGVRSMSLPNPVPADLRVEIHEDGNVRFLVDEDYRRRVMLSLVWRATEDKSEETDQAARGPSSSDSK